MAKITIAGDAVVITSAVKLEDMATISKYRPGALKLMGGENGKEVIFAIGVTNGAGSISKYGASFGGATHDEQKLATITLGIESTPGCGDIKDRVAEHVGTAIFSLNKIEAGLGDVLEEIVTERAAIRETISVV